MDETSRSQKYSFHVRVQAILRVPSQVQISPPETEITEHNSSSGTLDWASQVAQMVKKICLQCGRPEFNP